MICPGCSHDNDEARRYCGQCGTNLLPVCVRCGFQNRAPDRYCGGCGAGLAIAMSLPEDAARPAAAVTAAPRPAPAVAASPPPVPAKASAHLKSEGKDCNARFIDRHQ